MLIAKYSGRICRQCAAEAARHHSTGEGTSRGLSFYSRKRQKRTISGQASTWPSQPPFGDPFSFWDLPPPIYTPIIEWKGKARATEEAPEVAHEEVEEELKRVEERVGFDRKKLFAPGTSSISLDTLQQHSAQIKTESVSSQLRLLLWLIDLSSAPINDVKGNKRKWHVNVYRRAELEHRRGIRPKWGTMPTSLDLLCTDIIKRELRRDVGEDDLPLLKSLCFQALRKNGFRIVQAIDDWIKGNLTIEHLEGSPAFFLSIKESMYIRHAKRREWEAVWRQRDGILKLLRRQKEIGQLHNISSDEWRLDVALAKSLTAHCAQNYLVHRGKNMSMMQVDLAQDRYYEKHVTELVEEVKDIYGEISEKWLNNFILGLTRGLEPGTRLDTLSLTEYFDRLRLTNLAQQLFQEHCQKIDSPSSDLLHKMLALEMSWERHCRAYKGDVGKERMLQQAAKHHDNVESILLLLSKHDRRAASKRDTEPLPTRRQVMDDLEGRAYATEISVKLLLFKGDYQTVLQRLQAHLGTVRPEEDYYHLVGARFVPDLHTQQRTTAKAMAGTRRLTRGSFISIALHLDKSTLQDKLQAIPTLLHMMKDSIKRGVWDPWPLKIDSTRKRLRNLKVKPHFVDPCAALSGLCSRLLGMCRPVMPVHRFDVSQGYTVVDLQLSGIFCKVLEEIGLLHKAMEDRLAVLEEKQLLTLAANRIRSRVTLRDIFVRNATSAPLCIWGILANPLDVKMVASRMELLFEQVFVPLGLPRIGWASARLALEQRWPPHARSTELVSQVHALFEAAVQKMHKMGDVGSNHTVASGSGASKDRAKMRDIRRNLERRRRFKEKRMLALVVMRNRVIQRSLGRW